MAKKKVASKSVEQEEFNPEPIEEVTREDEKIIERVQKKKGLSSFGAMLKAQAAKRKARKIAMQHGEG